jgi:hypothetical protein
MEDDDDGWLARLGHVPERVDRTAFTGRVVLLAILAVWSWSLIRSDYRTGDLVESFLHRPLLIFHEAGHLVLLPFGEWIGVLGGTLGQLLMPAILGVALLWKNRDPFGGAVGLWFLGVSVMDVAPYMYDAQDPRLMLLSGHTGAEGGSHDWIYLFRSLGLLQRARMIGGMTHTLGAALVLLALAWAAWLLLRQRRRLAGDVLHED